MISTSVTNSEEAEETSCSSAACPSAGPEQEYNKTESPILSKALRAKGKEKYLNIKGNIDLYINVV
jgi:hypothetical protein